MAILNEEQSADMRGLQELLGLDLSDTANRESLLRRAAEIRTRLDFSARENVDLVTFESRETVEQGRLELLRGIVEARMALQNAGMTNEQISEAQARFAGEWDAYHFTQNAEQQDRAFRNYRLRNVAGAAAFGGLAGLRRTRIGNCSKRSTNRNTRLSRN